MFEGNMLITGVGELGKRGRQETEGACLALLAVFINMVIGWY